MTTTHPTDALDLSSIQPMNITNFGSAQMIDMIVPEGCFVLQPMSFIPWANPYSLVSLDVARMVSKIKGGYFLPLLFLIGFPANLINMAVFGKQGLRERINLCLCMLSLADLVFIVNTVLFYGDQFASQFAGTDIRFGPLFQFMVTHNMTGLFGFAWASMFMSAVIASERCFCIVYPLRSKAVLKTGTMAAIIAMAFLVLVGGFLFVGMRYEIVCLFDPYTNTITIQGSMTSAFYRRYPDIVDNLDNIVYGVILIGIFTVVVTATTAVTAVKIRKVVTWRTEISSSTTSAREVALTRMLIMASVLFTVCYTPKFLFGFTCIFVPELKAGRRNHNLFQLCASVTEMLSCINASFNFFLYFYMGSRYRETFWEIFRLKIPKSSVKQKIGSVISRNEQYKVHPRFSRDNV